MKFKKDDKIKIVGKVELINGSSDELMGLTGNVVGIDNDCNNTDLPYLVSLSGNEFWFGESSLELIEEAE